MATGCVEIVAEKLFVVWERCGPHSQGCPKLCKPFGRTLGVSSFANLCAGIDSRRICLKSHENQWGIEETESLRQRMEEDLVKIKANRTLVLSFFGAKKVAYTDD